MEFRAKTLLVEAIRAADRAQTLRDAGAPQAALEALDQALAALARIDADYAASDVGIALLTGQSFGDFDPDALVGLRVTLEKQAIVAQCRAAFAPICGVTLYLDAASAATGRSPEAILRGDATLAVMAALAESDPDEAARRASELSQSRFGALLTTLVDVGRHTAIIEILERLPDDHFTRVGVGADKVDRLAAEMTARDADGHAARPARKRMGLNALIDSGLVDADALTLTAGSPERIAEVLARRDDPVAAAKSHINSNPAIPAAGRAMIGLALLKIGHAEGAFEILADRDVLTSGPAREFMPAALRGTTALAYLIEGASVLKAFGGPGCADAAVFVADGLVALAPADRALALAEPALRNAMACMSEADAWDKGDLLGIAAGLDPTGGDLEAMTALGAAMDPEARQFFIDGLQDGHPIGAMAADPDGAGRIAFDAAMLTLEGKF